MAELPSLDRLPCVPPAVRDDPRYVGDHVIRHYRDRTLADLARDLGHDLPDPFQIVGGIGILTLSATDASFAPAIPDRPPQDDRRVPQAVIDRRTACCAVCPHYQADADRCRMCGCSGQQAHRVTRPWASCPAGYWAAVASSPPPTP